METHFKVIIAVLPIALLVGPLGTTLAIAQPRQNGPTSQNARAPYAAQYEGRITVRANHTATEVFTKRFKILTPSAIQLVGQQQLLFMEGMQTLDTIEAFTEKSDGRRLPVDPASIITRDAVSGLPG